MSVGRAGQSVRFFPHRSHVSGKRQIRFAQRIEENLLFQVDKLSAELCVPSQGNDDGTDEALDTEGVVSELSSVCFSTRLFFNVFR